MSMSKPTLITMDAVWLLARLDYYHIKAHRYSLPLCVNLFQLNMNAIDDIAISICEFDFVEDRHMVEQNPSVCSTIT